MVIQGSQEVNTVFDQAQLRKGTLEGCILKIISREPTYGYAIAVTLRESGFADLTEGTLYPLLLRLELVLLAVVARQPVVGIRQCAGLRGRVEACFAFLLLLPFQGLDPQILPADT